MNTICTILYRYVHLHTHTHTHTIMQISSCQWFLPLQWIQHQVEERLVNGSCAPPIAGRTLDNIARVRESHRRLYVYDWVCVLLVYTQVCVCVCVCQKNV